MSVHESLRISFDPKNIARLMPFKAAADIRYYLCGIQIERAPQELGGVFLAACDGHTLALIHDKSGSIEGADSAIVRIESGCVAAAKAAGKKKQALMKHRLLVRGRRVLVAPGFEWEEAGQELYVQPGHAVIEGKYPDWRKVVPDFDKLKRGALSAEEVNPSYLARLSQLTDGARHGGAVSLWQEEPGKPLICQIRSIPEMVVIIMPMRGEQNESSQRAMFPRFTVKQPVVAAAVESAETAEA